MGLVLVRERRTRGEWRKAREGETVQGHYSGATNHIGQRLRTEGSLDSRTLHAPHCISLYFSVFRECVRVCGAHTGPQVHPRNENLQIPRLCPRSAHAHSPRHRPSSATASLHTPQLYTSRFRVFTRNSQRIIETQLKFNSQLCNN